MTIVLSVVISNDTVHVACGCGRRLTDTWVDRATELRIACACGVTWVAARNARGESIVSMEPAR